MVLLLHSIDRTALQAIVAGTVAYTSALKQSKWLKMPTELEGKVPGVYVIGLKRRGLKPEDEGKFLNIKETEALIGGLERYVKGSRLCRTHATTSSLTAAESALVNVVGNVDWYGGHGTTSGNIPSPQCIQSDAEFEKIVAVISMFKSCCDWTKDPTGLVRQTQTPLYVGCSIDLRERTNAYKRHVRGGLSKVNKPLCLVVNTLTALNLPVDLSIQIAVRTWDGIPLPVAERLVTTVACSFVYQHGFNAIEAGGTGTSTSRDNDSVLKKSAELLFGHMDTTKENLEATMAEIDDRADFLDNLEFVSEKAQDLIQQAEDLAKNEPRLNGATFDKLKQEYLDRSLHLAANVEKLDRLMQRKDVLLNTLETRLGLRKVDDAV